MIVPSLTVKEASNGQRSGNVVFIRFSLVSGISPGVYLYDPTGNLAELLMNLELRLGRLQQTVGVLAGDIDLVLIGTLREIFARAELADREEFKASLVNAYHCARYYAPELKRYAIFISTPKEVVIVGGSAGATYAVGMYVLVRNLPTRPGVAMTGTISPNGDIGPVAGIKEKVTAAMRLGFRTVLLPAANLADLGTSPLPVTVIPVRHFAEAVYHFTGHIPEEGYKQMLRDLQRVRQILADPKGDLEVAAQIAEKWLDLLPELASQEEDFKKAIRIYRLQRAINRCFAALKAQNWGEALINFVAAHQFAPDDPLVKDQTPQILALLATHLSEYGETFLQDDFHHNVLLAFGDLLAKTDIPKKAEATNATLQIAQRLFDAGLQSEEHHPRFQRWLAFAQRFAPLDEFFQRSASTLQTQWQRACQQGDLNLAKRLYALALLLPNKDALLANFQTTVQKAWKEACDVADVRQAFRLTPIAEVVSLPLVTQKQIRWLQRLADEWERLTDPSTCLAIVSELLKSNDANTIVFVLPFLIARMPPEATSQKSLLNFLQRFFSDQRPTILSEWVMQLADQLANFQPRSLRTFPERVMAGMFVGTDQPPFWVALSSVFQPNASLTKAFVTEAMERRPLNPLAVWLPFLMGNFAGERFPPLGELPSTPLIAHVQDATAAQRAGHFLMAAAGWEKVSGQILGAHRELAACYAASGNWGLAWFWMLQHLRQNPFDPLALSDVAWWCLLSTAPKAGERLLTQLIKTHPLCPYVWSVVLRYQKQGFCLGVRPPFAVQTHPLLSAPSNDYAEWLSTYRPIVVLPSAP
ncbi:MAG: S16 family serine protease [Armatimonadota bacterium]|nr:S16 family serine protease [Armatimonadota bacterium]